MHPQCRPGGCYELVIRLLRLRVESVRAPLAGVRILPPSGGDGLWWGASTRCVKRLLVAVPMVVGCEAGANPRLARSLQVGWAGQDLGERMAPESALGPVDPVGQVRVDTSRHAQRCDVLVRGADGALGLRHDAGGLGDDGGVFYRSWRCAMSGR